MFCAVGAVKNVLPLLVKFPGRFSVVLMFCLLPWNVTSPGLLKLVPALKFVGLAAVPANRNDDPADRPKLNGPLSVPPEEKSTDTGPLVDVTETVPAELNG